jgi:hypothetical protein
MRYWRENLPILLWIMILGCAGIILGEREDPFRKEGDESECRRKA